MFNREAHMDVAPASREVIFFESSDGPETTVDGDRSALLRDYRTYTHMSWVDQKRTLPSVLNFEPCTPAGSPRIAVAN